MTLLVNLFLPIKGKVVAVFSHHDLRQQAPGAGRLRSNNRSGNARRSRAHRQGWSLGHIFPAHHPAFEETARLIIQLLADFLADAAPRFGLGLDRFGVDDFLHHRQVLRQARHPWLGWLLERSLSDATTATAAAAALSGNVSNSSWLRSSCSLLAPKTRLTSKSIF